MAADTSELIHALESEWRDALCAKNIGRLAELIHPDFVLIGTRSSGPFVMHREEWLDAIQHREVVDINLKVQDSQAFDQVMVGTVQARWRVNYLGKQFDDCVLLTDVWVCIDDRWQVVRRHSTPLPPNQCVSS